MVVAVEVADPNAMDTSPVAGSKMESRRYIYNLIRARLVNNHEPFVFASAKTGEPMKPADAVMMFWALMEQIETEMMQQAEELL